MAAIGAAGRARAAALADPDSLVAAVKPPGHVSVLERGQSPDPEVGQPLGRWGGGHPDVPVISLLRSLERGGHRKDGLAVLGRGDAAVGVRATVV